jgi:hypothetical protein
MCFHLALRPNEALLQPGLFLLQPSVLVPEAFHLLLHHYNFNPFQVSLLPAVWGVGPSLPGFGVVEISCVWRGGWGGTIGGDVRVVKMTFQPMSVFEPLSEAPNREHPAKRDGGDALNCEVMVLQIPESIVGSRRTLCMIVDRGSILRNTEPQGELRTECGERHEHGSRQQDHNVNVEAVDREHLILGQLHASCDIALLESRLASILHEGSNCAKAGFPIGLCGGQRVEDVEEAPVAATVIKNANVWNPRSIVEKLGRREIKALD